MLDNHTQIALSAFYQGVKELARRANSENDLAQLPLVLRDCQVNDTLLYQAQKCVLGADNIDNPPEFLTPLLSQILQEKTPKNKIYPLLPLSPEHLFPRDKGSLKADFLALWREFLNKIKQIPQDNPVLFLDHLDTLWQHIAWAVPVTSNISLYDLNKNTAAIMVALSNKQADKQQPLLLVQGDFAGIQNFIFASGKDANKSAAKLLRGRSFQVSLFSELAALKVLQACHLPPTSQVLNAAGKFQIIAANTPEIVAALNGVKQEINQWFLDNAFGQMGMALSFQAASETDFADSEKYKELIKKSFAQLEKAKLQRFDLLDKNAPTVLNADFSSGENPYNERLPNNNPISLDQITIGTKLTSLNTIYILSQQPPQSVVQLKTPIFGFYIAFGKDNSPLENAVRCWDFSLPEKGVDLWCGLARRYVNAYIPHFADDEKWDKYIDIDEEVNVNQPKTFSHIACEDRYLNDKNEWQGKVAIGVLKGDIDNLGRIFQQGLPNNNLAKTAALSRQINLFFTVYLPYLCQTEFTNTYTVFAGGDDFFLIGAWHSVQKLAVTMRQEFKRFVADNDKLSFSVGISTHKAGVPLSRLAMDAEHHLSQAKNEPNKNAVCVFGACVKWSDWEEKVKKPFDDIGRLKNTFTLSTGYIYGCLQFCDMRQKEKDGIIQAALWRSRLAYRSKRMIDDNRIQDNSNSAFKEINSVFANGIENNTAFRIALFNHLYLLRDK